MTALIIIINILLILTAIVLIVAVLMQEGNRAGLGAIGGGAETFFGKSKGKSLQGKLQLITKIGAVVFIVLAIACTALVAYQDKADRLAAEALLAEQAEQAAQEAADAEAEVPATEPEAPATEPEAPVTEPEAPATEPEAPVAEPEVPATEAPATEPEAPVAEPAA